ncbi:MAG: SGNH/GDSL hydrolase family protein [Actinomycetota bacterium]
MSTAVPSLTPLPVGKTIRLLGVLLPGMRRVTAQIGPYTAWWDRQNQEAVNADGPLLVAVGDSTAIGVGASAPDRGYVGRLADRLSDFDGVNWRVVNLALSGARLQDALDRQLPILDDLRPDAVICCVGTNDVVWERSDGMLRRRLQELTDRLPSRSVVGVAPGASWRSRMANRTIRQGAAGNDLVVVDPWNEPGPAPLRRVSADRFHPNDIGYGLMAKAFARAMGRLDADEPPTV